LKNLVIIISVVISVLIILILFTIIQRRTQQCQGFKRLPTSEEEEIEIELSENLPDDFNNTAQDLESKNV